jgi:ribosome-associated translation inhibitor RaiA
MNWQQRIMRTFIMRPLLAILLVVILGVGTIGCSRSPGAPASGAFKPSSRLSEVAPPATIQELRKALEIHQPQVKILSPRADEVLQDTSVSVRLQVNDLPLFQNEEFGLGPHLHFILDNEPYQAIYDTKEPIALEDLAPGTHTLRVFASRPWHESFKNDGAYAQTTFHVFAKTPEDIPAPNQPLLTYSRPKGSYGAEPIMLDFYLANAPLHLVANESAEDEIADWQIRCTINGESFTFDRWEPIYLKGFKPGRNWVQLELLDEQGNLIPNDFNDTVRLITYEPGGTDTLSKLTRGEISVAEVLSIVDPDYVYVPPAPEPEPEPVVEPEPAVELTPEVEQPTVTEEPALTPEAESLQEVLDDIREPVPPAEPTPLPTPEPTGSTPESELPPELTTPPIPKTVELEGVDRLNPSVIEEQVKIEHPASMNDPLKAAPPSAIEPSDNINLSAGEDVSVRDELTEKVQQKLEEVQQKFDELSNELSGELKPMAMPESSSVSTSVSTEVPAATSTAPTAAIETAELSPAPVSSVEAEPRPRKLVDRAKGVLNRFRSPSTPTQLPATSETEDALNSLVQSSAP